jgi:hypothetical protein
MQEEIGDYLITHFNKNVDRLRNTNKRKNSKDFKLDNNEVFDESGLL